MPFVNRVLNPSSTGQNVPALTASLHRELALVGSPVAGTEASGRTYGAATEASVREFQKRFGLRETGELDPASGGIMALAAMVTEEGDREKLRRELRDAVNRVPNSPEYAYWLARYAIMAGDYQTAHNVARRFSDFAPIVAVIDPVVEIPDRGPSAPEVPHPENFYTYRHELLPQADLTQLRHGVGDLTVDQYKLDLGIPAHWEISESEFQDAKKDSSILLEAMQEWQEGIQDSFNRQYARAAIHYESCQRAVIRYFKEELALSVTGDLDRDLASVLDLLINSEAYKWSPLWGAIRWRRSLLSLKEIYEHDWVYPRGADETYSVAGKYVVTFFNFADILMSVPTPGGPKMKVETRVIAPLVLIAFVFVPLARAEDNRLRRQFDAALLELDKLLAFNNGLAPQYRLLCEFIEIPFIRLLKGETLLDKADAQFKARVLVTPADSFPDARHYHNMLAAKTYLEVFTTFQPDEQYVPYVQTARDRLKQKLTERIAQGDTNSRQFHVLIKGVTIPVVSAVGGALPGLDRRAGPHERLVAFTPPSGQDVMRETNPRVYALLLEAQARLEQLRAGFNYFGYSDDYVPPWRFQFLLDRARYFTEHARNAQREYLNFLNNAEREEFQELSATQNVEMEKSNVRIETARVDQVRLEVTAANESKRLADEISENAGERFRDYIEMDEKIHEKESDSLLGSVIGGALSLGIGIFTGNPAMAVGGLEAMTVGVASQSASASISQLQREHEKLNLQLAEQEARQSAVVAQVQLAAAQAGLLVAGLQRQAALLRHEFAVQNLNFLRNRTLNAELWYRLSGAIRSVADTYLRYAIEMAFLAEQSYEFEADRRINVIRFDYDVSDLGDMLAGDFLLRDLDTLEQDLIVGQRLRQQQVRYVLSLAREFPETLQELRDHGQMIFSLRLEQLERRFPGLYNFRITSVEMLPIALMDPTRFSLEMTHLGTGQVRLKAQPDTPPGTESTSPLNTADADDWLEGLRTEWPVKIRITGPDTAVYSGLTRQDLAGLPSFFAANQRGAFEGLAGASSWRVDLSMKENRIVPDTLADLLITFTLSGYYDASLRQAIDAAPRKTMAMTTWFSAHQTFPDAFFQFNRSGRIDWQVSPDFLRLQGSLGALRNVAVLLPPATKRPELGRLICSYAIEFEAASTGEIRMLAKLPNMQLSISQLTLNAQIGTPSPGNITWDFGDGTGIFDSGAFPHTYAKPGRYEVTMRIVSAGRLVEYRAAVVVSRQHEVVPPLIVVPRLRATFEGGKIKVMPSLQSPAGQSLSVKWRVDNLSPDNGSGPVTFSLDPPTAMEGSRRHTLRFTAVRQLKGRFYSQQRYATAAPLRLDGLHLATNRTFDSASGAETTTSPNPFAQHVFGTETLSPTDRWTFELPMEDNPCLMSVSPTDVKQYDLSELADAALSLEYEVRDV
jgi:peptidoglycan hydrolase-like protein with peptidoglycan-binding domain